MGWASGSYMAEDMWDNIKKFIRPKYTQPTVARIIVDAFEDGDADDWSCGKDSLYETAYPEKCQELEEELNADRA